MTVEQAVIERLRVAMPELRQHSVQALWIFGSVARGEAREESDVDVLVDFSRPVSLFQLGGLQQRLEEILGRKVDLVVRDGLRPALRKQILAEAVRAA